jgi:hypothetical protein
VIAAVLVTSTSGMVLVTVTEPPPVLIVDSRFNCVCTAAPSVARLPDGVIEPVVTPL